MSDFGSGLEQFGPMHELSGRASKADLRRRIAELEADLALSREQTEYANDAMMAMCERAQRAEDKLAALKARRCENCQNGPPGDWSVEPPEVYCGYHSTWWDLDDFCSRFAERETT